MEPLRLEPDDDRLATKGLGVEHPGLCFNMAGDYVCDQPGTLVHGTARLALLPIPFNHAWVLTPDGLVYDGTLGGFFDRANYYRTFKVTEDAVYPRDLARQMLLEHDTYGPWHSPWHRVAL